MTKTDADTIQEYAFLGTKVSPSLFPRKLLGELMQAELTVSLIRLSIQ